MKIYPNEDGLNHRLKYFSLFKFSYGSVPKINC